jgi:hypothetical protein
MSDAAVAMAVAALAGSRRGPAGVGIPRGRELSRKIPAGRGPVDALE